MSNDLSAKIISWNMGESVTHIKDWTTELNNWPIITDEQKKDENTHGHDIIFFTIQEASKKVGNEIGSVLKEILIDYNIYFEGQGTWLPTMNFHVFGYLCIRKGIDVTAEPVENDKKNKSIHSVCIMKKRTCSKSAVAFGVEANGKKLIFVGSHLPVDTKDKITYGYNLRIDAMKTIQKEVIENVADAIGGADNIFWTGDMNFRVLEDGSEQLQTALSEQTLQSYGYIEYNKDDVIKTCRYREYSDKKMKETAKNLELDDKALIDLHANFIDDRLQGTDAAYDDRRIPSYCDRVIYKGEIDVKRYYSWPQPPYESKYPQGIAYSDHVPIVFEGTVPITTPMTTPISIQKGELTIAVKDSGTENDIYRKKYAKYKAKYLQLRKEISLKSHMKGGASKPYEFMHIDLTNEERDLNQDILIENEKHYDHYGKYSDLDSRELYEYIEKIGNNKREVIDAVHRSMLKIVDQFSRHYSKINPAADAAWITIRPSNPNNMFKIPRWHQDGRFFDTEGDVHKFATVLTGPSTLIATIPLSEYDEFNEVHVANRSKKPFDSSQEQWKYEDKVIRPKLQEFISNSFISVPDNYGLIFLTGDHDAAIHSEPHITTKRLFMSILPGTHQQITERSERVAKFNAPKK